MKILSIETSCDETSVAILEIKNGVFNLLSNIVSSQIKIHAKYGGIIPEIAARMQIEMILPIIEQALQKAKITPLKSPLRKGRTNIDIDYIAFTQGPGLITSLTVGVETAKMLALSLNKPLIPVNHLLGHLLANHLENPPATSEQAHACDGGRGKKIKYPAVGLIVSGGHTMLLMMKSEINYKIIGQTVDDAVGEAFDKVAKILNLGYPGGPIISKLATQGDKNKFKFPRPMISQNNLDFSFSGLKTAVLYKVKKLKSQKVKKETKDICASFQQACIDVLISKTLRAIKQHKPRSFLLGGGVSANSELRKQLQEKINKLNLTPPYSSPLKGEEEKIQIFIPPLNLTGDNAGMIAVAGYFKIKNSKKLPKNKIYNLRADPNLKL